MAIKALRIDRSDCAKTSFCRPMAQRGAEPTTSERLAIHEVISEANKGYGIVDLPALLKLWRVRHAEEVK